MLTDVRMPGMDGLELLQRIREIRPEAKVMVMTADSTPANIVRAIRDQAFCYFSKPFSPSAVAEMIAQAVNTGHWQDDIEVLSASPEWISLRLRCKMETADRLMQFVREMEMDFPPHERENIAAAFRELLMNAIEHGGGSDPDEARAGDLRAHHAGHRVPDPGSGQGVFVRRDRARGHRATRRASRPVTWRSARSRASRPGGFGILLTRNLVDELIYSEKGNEVLFIKYLK